MAAVPHGGAVRPPEDAGAAVNDVPIARILEVGKEVCARLAMCCAC